MKQYLMILIAIACFGINANADGEKCPIPGTSYSIAITKVNRVLASPSRSNDSPHIAVAISNLSKKTVSFAITPKNGQNVSGGTEYETVKGGETSFVDFYAEDSSKPIKIPFFFLQVQAVRNDVQIYQPSL